MSLPGNWNKWVIENLLRGTDPQQLLNILLENGFTFESAKKALGKNLSPSINHPRDQHFYRNLCQPALVTQSEKVGAVRVESPKAQFYLIENFMSEPECQEIIDLAKTQLRPSEITDKAGNEGFRTSTTSDLPYLNHPAADAIDKKIIDCLGVGLGEKEVIQAQHYAVGQQFKAHTDYFEPGSEGYKTYSKDGGQRTWTFMVYLNEGCEGGETEFPLLNQKFKPKTGMALVWNNLLIDGSPNPATLHQAHPVKSGEKVVITKWFREWDPDS